MVRETKKMVQNGLKNQEQTHGNNEEAKKKAWTLGIYRLKGNNALSIYSKLFLFNLHIPIL